VCEDDGETYNDKCVASRDNVSILHNRVQQFCPFLRKLNISVLELVEDEIPRPVCKKTFFHILAHSVRNLLQSFQKMLIGTQKIFF